MLEPVHRPEDGELVGHLAAAADRDGWTAHAVFGAPLRTLPTRAEAAAFLRARGLALLAERWQYRPADGGEPRTAWLVEARPGAVVVRFGHDPASVPLRGADLERLTLP
ncbi:hypothetical protein SAMN05660690_2122 [Geodermatophilus telluris]|uniref:Uncharacterized protein n=1 Tax=Geodermatophilus telluris TaxID=1190417 RepID=A0A1G6N1N0_9ACTN|nr:hypothetical protein SAMN05660690_2122 [Geodermatophilus telluris]